MMLALIDQGYSEDESICLNRVRCHQQVLFISDVFDASGRALDWRYLTRRQMNVAWSTLLFPREAPPNRDIHLWQQALHLLVSQGRAAHQLGRFTENGHKIWEWRFDPGSNRLYNIRGASMDIYLPTHGDDQTRCPNQWYCAHRGEPRVDRGTVCTLRDTGGGDKAIICHANDSWTTSTTLDFWGVLRKWQQTWMWDNLQWVGDDDWLVIAITEGTFIAVTDGSYMKDLYPNINLAAVVLECTKVGGGYVAHSRRPHMWPVAIVGS
jgi:hypothetical protein